MQAVKQILRLALAGMIAAAVVAPAAGAMPAQDGQAYDVNRVTGEYTPADKNATTIAPVGSDLRTEGSTSPIVSRSDTTLGAVGRGHASEPAKPGVLHSTPIVKAAPAPVAATDTGNGAFDWSLAGLIAGGVIALAGAALLTRHQLRGHVPAH